MNDVCFSGSAIAIVSGLVAGLTGAVTLLFRELIKAKDEAINLAWRQTELTDETVTTARELVTPRRGGR